jgi:hypothetical protein
MYIVDAYAYYSWQMQQHRIIFFFATTAVCTCTSDLRKNKNKAEETVADEIEMNERAVSIFLAIVSENNKVSNHCHPYTGG